MNFKINTVVLIFAIISLALMLLLVLVLLIGKKDEASRKKKKGLVVLLSILTILSVVATPLVYSNIIPLSLHLGYYIEMNDVDNNGKMSGLKITMEKHVDFYNQIDINNTSNRSDKSGKLIIQGSFVTFYDISSDPLVYEIKGFGKELYLDGVLAYKFFKDIEGPQ